MITYTCCKNSHNSNLYVVDFSNENDDKYLNYTDVLIKNEGNESCYRINFLNWTGLNPRLIVDDDYLLIGVDYGMAIIGSNLKIVNSIRSKYLFFDVVFSQKQILIIFECELCIYDIANNSIKFRIPLKDMVNDFYMEKNYFIYNTIESSIYNRVYIGKIIDSQS